MSTSLARAGIAATAQMYLKTAAILGWFAASYALLVFFAAAWWPALPLAISLGLSMAAVGFNIEHDGGHQAYSNRPWINRLMARTLDLMGGSSYGGVLVRIKSSIQSTAFTAASTRKVP